MKHFLRIWLIFVVMQIVAINTYAQKLGDTLKIEEVEINSLRPVKFNSLRITRFDSLVLRTNKGNSLSELLAEHSGIFIKSYGRGAMASASFRGTDPSHTKVLWNGIELNSPMLGMVDFSLIPMFFIDNVELFHGTSSMSEASGALGGLINLSTEPDWTNSFSGSYMQGAGSYGTHDEHISLEIGNKKFQSQTRVFYAHSDNDFSFENHDIYDSVNLETGRRYYPRMINKDAWFSYYGVLQEFHYRPGKNNFFSMSFWGQESSRSIPLLSTRESDDIKNRQTDKSIRSHISYKHYGERYSFKVFSGLNTMNLLYSEKIQLSDLLYQYRSNSENVTASLYNKMDLEYRASKTLELEISAGADLHRVRSLEKVSLLGYSKSRMQLHMSVSAAKKWNERLNSSLKAGAEYISEGLTAPVMIAGSEFHVLPDNRLYLKLLLATNSRFPSLNDLYYQPWGNKDLRQERSMDQELGIHFSSKNGRWEFSQDAAFYMSQVRNWIMWKYKANRIAPENIEKVDIKGLEVNFSLGYKVNLTRITLSSGYGMTHSRDMEMNLNEYDYSFGKQLPYIPVHSANAMFFINQNTWSLNYIWNFYSERNVSSSGDEANRRDVLYPYYMSQIGLGKQVQLERLSFDFSLRIHNLFNEEYRSVLQRPMPGRNYSLQLKIDF